MNQLNCFLVFMGESFYAPEDATPEEMVKAICDQSDIGVRAEMKGKTICLIIPTTQWKVATVWMRKDEP